MLLLWMQTSSALRYPIVIYKVPEKGQIEILGPFERADAVKIKK